MSIPNAEHEALAIAYLTGQASTDEIAAYQALFEEDETFRQTVRDVEIWLAPLNEDVPEMEAPEGLFDALMAEIAPQDPSFHELADPVFEQSSEGPLASNDNGAKKWKMLAIAASLLAIAAVGSHFVNLGASGTNVQESPPVLQAQEKQDQGQQFLALLSDSTQPELVAIIYNPATGHVVARLSNITVPEDGDLQLWLIREGEGAPQSLGVMERAGEGNQLEFDIPTALQSGTDILAISLEQKGGSPSAGPEGPVLFTGAVTPLQRDI